MESKGYCSQEPVIGHSPDPVESHPHPSTSCNILRSILILSSHLYLDLSMVLFSFLTSLMHTTRPAHLFLLVLLLLKTLIELGGSGGLKFSAVEGKVRQINKKKKNAHTLLAESHMKRMVMFKYSLYNYLYLA
jgi:hypothetical protein